MKLHQPTYVHCVTDDGQSRLLRFATREAAKAFVRTGQYRVGDRVYNGIPYDGLMRDIEVTYRRLHP